MQWLPSRLAGNIPQGDIDSAHRDRDRPTDPPPGCTAHVNLHLLHGQQDESVPWQRSMRISEAITGGDVTVTLIKDGDHRLSRPEDIERLLGAVAEFSA